jgi:hypothetical protein
MPQSEMWVQKGFKEIIIGRKDGPKVCCIRQSRRFLWGCDPGPSPAACSQHGAKQGLLSPANGSRTPMESHKIDIAVPERADFCRAGGRPGGRGGPVLHSICILSTPNRQPSRVRLLEVTPIYHNGVIWS